MSLCICGRFDLSQLEAWVTEKFSPVVNKDVKQLDLSKPEPYPKENLGKLVKFIPIRDEDILSMVYFLPYCENDHKTKPLSYLSQLIGHEGENSLLSFLKNEDYALALSAGSSHWGDCLSYFTIKITLTKKGLENYERVIEIAFKYLQKIREIGPQKFFFDELLEIGKMQFEFADKEDAIDDCSFLARKMHHFDDDNITEILRC